MIDPEKNSKTKIVQEKRWPVFVNPTSGNFKQIMSVLDGDKRILLHCLPPKEMAAALDQEISQECPRVIVSGGDGTLALAASRLAGTNTELAVLPGGTLNHFAGRLEIPDDIKSALDLAITGGAHPVAAGYVNDQLFLNTSSVGAYVFFVRTREQLENNMSYHSASLLAGLRRLARFRSAKLNVNGNTLRSPLVFVGVNERELRFPALGQEKPEGGEGLHIIVVKSRGRVETLKIACKAFFRGVDPLEQTKDVENLIRAELELSYHRKKRKIAVALDGELFSLTAPLKYRFEPAAFSVVMPQPSLQL